MGTESTSHSISKKKKIQKKMKTKRSIPKKTKKSKKIEIKTIKRRLESMNSQPYPKIKRKLEKKEKYTRKRRRYQETISLSNLIQKKKNSKKMKKTQSPYRTLYFGKKKEKRQKETKKWPTDQIEQVIRSYIYIIVCSYNLNFSLQTKK